jgi:hypothetical protein
MVIIKRSIVLSEIKSAGDRKRERNKQIKKILFCYLENIFS